MKITERFAALDENLKLDPQERQRAQKVHNYINDVLVDAGIAKRTKLQGSFARKTMLPPLHDIDKVVELTDDLAAELAGPAGPGMAIERIRAALLPVIPNAQYVVKKHALGVVLPEDTFDFDAVPALNSEDSSKWIRIANTQPGPGEEVWKPSDTYELITVVSVRNQLCGGRFVRQVRMAKQVIETAGISKELPGLHVESFAYEAITRPMAHAKAVAATLAKANELLGGPYTEPTGEDQISDRLEPWKVATAHATVAKVAASAAQALHLAAGDNETAAGHIWADLFGEKFPRPTDAEEKKIISGLFAGSIVAPTNRPTPTTRAWRP
jgi:hypothetical protein